MQPTSADCLARAEVPDWVVPITAPETTGIPEQEHRGGIQAMLLDRQVHMERAEVFLHRVSRVLSGTGLQTAAILRIEFNPTYQNVLLHAVDILRSGRRESRLALERFSTVAVEREQERFVYNGTLEAVLHLDDVRVGDTVEVAFTIRGESPVYRGSSWSTLPLYAPFSLGLMHHRLLAAVDRHLDIRLFAGASQPSVREFDGLAERVWRLADYRPQRMEDGVPEAFFPFPFCQVSDGRQWTDVAAWARDLFPAPEVDDPVFEGQVAALRDGYAGREERIVAALRFVQGEIRYLAFNDGAATLRARPPGIVVRQRYGDCKDKAWLLCCLLRAMGVKAAPALVNTALRIRLEELSPSINLFNHCVVRVDSGPTARWYDPTLPPQGGRYDEIGFPDLGAALVVADGTTGLSPIAPALRGRSVVHEVYTETEGSTSMDLVVETEHFGAAADLYRNLAAMEGTAAVARRFKEFYFTHFSELEVAEPLAIQDDLEGNRFAMREHYRLVNPWKKNEPDPARILWVAAHPVLGSLQQPMIRQRQLPLALAQHADVCYEAEVHHDGSCQAVSGDLSLESHGLVFERQVKPSDRTLNLHCRLQIVRDRVQPEEIGEYLKTVEHIRTAVLFAVVKPAAAPPGLTPRPAKASEPRWWMMYLGIALVMAALSAVRQCSP